ncbi:MAG: GNAT family N-acetyltransferase [Rhizobium sp.]
MEYDVRPAEEDDAEGISAVIVSALRQTNAKDYSPEIIARVAAGFHPAAIRKLLAGRTVFVAATDGDIIGTASLDGAMIRTVFVSPSAQGRGVGRRLMAEIERIARAKGISVLTVPSSVTAQAFYAALGFRPIRESYYGDERTIIMERSLEA